MPLTIVEVEALRELVAAELEKNGGMDELWRRAWCHAHTDGGTKDLLAGALSRVIDRDDMPRDPSKDFTGHVTFAIRHSWYRRTSTSTTAIALTDRHWG